MENISWCLMLKKIWFQSPVILVIDICVTSPVSSGLQYEWDAEFETGTAKV